MLAHVAFTKFKIKSDLSWKNHLQCVQKRVWFSMLYLNIKNIFTVQNCDVKKIDPTSCFAPPHKYTYKPYRSGRVINNNSYPDLNIQFESACLKVSLSAVDCRSTDKVFQSRWCNCRTQRVQSIVATSHLQSAYDVITTVLKLFANTQYKRIIITICVLYSAYIVNNNIIIDYL